LPDHSDDEIYFDGNGSLTERRRLGGQAMVVHYDDLPEKDITVVEGIPCTTALRTVIDIPRTWILVSCVASSRTASSGGCSAWKKRKTGCSSQICGVVPARSFSGSSVPTKALRNPAAPQIATVVRELALSR